MVTHSRGSHHKLTLLNLTYELSLIKLQRGEPHAWRKGSHNDTRIGTRYQGVWARAIFCAIFVQATTFVISFFLPWRMKSSKRIRLLKRSVCFFFFFLFFFLFFVLQVLITTEKGGKNKNGRVDSSKSVPIQVNS